MKRNQKSQTYPKQRGKLFLAITLLSALLLGIVFAGLGPLRPVTAQRDNPNPPAQVVKLVFIHHSCGENWLTDGHGNLGLTLGNNNYFVSDTNYGWGPDSIGDRTDILDWPEWFNGPDSDVYLDALYNLSEQNSWYTRQLADPGGENQIVMFKSCFPNSALEGSPGDPPSGDDYLTVGSAKRVYIDLLSYFATHQDKLFIAVTAPPLLDATHSANARAFNNWLVHDWLRDYPYSNVAVFDFYNILTGPDNHHRFYNGTIEHVTPGDDTLYYPTDGDEHPNPAGNQKATDEFVPLLNVYYHRWQAEGPPSQPAPTQPPAIEEPAAEEPATEEPGAEEPGAAAGASVDDFEGTYEPDQEWGVWVEEQTDTSLAFTLDDEVVQSGSAALRVEFDIAPASWADVSRSFAPVQDWSDGAGLSMWLRFSGDAEAGQAMSVILFAGDPEDATPFEAWFEISPESTEWPVVSEAEGWLLVKLPWDRFFKADWASEGGLPELDLSQMVGISLSFGAPDDSQAESVVWVDDIRLLSEGRPVIDKWALWINGTQLRGANIYQRRVYPELDGPEFMGPGSLGPPYTQEDFDQLAALGANYVNISHPGLFTEEPPYILDEAVQDNLDNLLDMIAQADMFAVISFRTGPGRSEFSVCCLEEAGDWYDESYLNDTVWQDPEAQEAWAAMWRYTAERYRDNPIVVGYDLMVEPNSNEVPLDLWDPEEFYAEYEGTLYDWNQMYPPVVAAIREVDPDTPIIVGGMAYSAVEWLPYLEPTEDLLTVYAIHQYAPFRYTHQWLDSLEFSYPGDLDTDWDGVEDQFDQAWLDDLMSTVDAFMTKHDVLVAANEFGLMRWQPGAAEFMDDQMALFEERGINYALWEWQTSWEPFVEEVHAFNFRLGSDPDSRADVASSDLMDVITHYWGRNTIRPSNVATDKVSVLINDFEDGDVEDRWWSNTGEGTTSFSCTPDQPGHASAQAMRLAFELDEDDYAGCGLDVDPDLWEEATDLSFFWRSDQPGLSVIVALGMQDPTQTNPETEGVTPFEAELQTSGEEWTPVTLTWDAFAKAEWVGEGGVDVLDLTQVTEVYFEVIGPQTGSVWFDDLELHKELTIPSTFTFAYESRPDGAAQLSAPPLGASGQNPAFSPDGTHLLFTRFENGYNQGPSALYLLDLTSGATGLLTTAPDSDNVNLPGSSWNAATKRITFASDRADIDEVWTIAADGSDPFRVTDHATAEYFLEPSFSPDGEWIVFEVDPDVPEDEQEGSIWKVRADGTGMTQLTDGPGRGTDDRQPNWSPSGDRILFQRRTPGSDGWDLYTIDPDGNGLQQVTDTPSSDTDASWSPDGRWIVYSSDYGGLPVPNIFVIPAIGGKPFRVTYDDVHEDGAPSWSPDGRWIAFESRPGDEDLPAALWLTFAPFTATEPARQVPTQAVSPPTASSLPAEQVYYVAANEPGASDDNNGLYPTYQGGQDGPWLTIQHAASTMTAGATTYVRAGTYYESGIIFAHSGAPGAPITLANYQSEEVVIDGSQSTDETPGIGIVEGRGHYFIQGFAIRNMGWSGIATDEETTDPFQDITIRDCILHDNGWSGIDLAAVDGFVVENVESYDNAFYGLNIISSEDGALSAANGIVRNSSFHHHTGDEGHGMAINQGHDITVSDSVAYHNTIHGFDVSDWPKYGELSYNITFERNFSYDNGVTGFAINSDSHHVVFRNNVAWRNGADWAGQGSSSGFLCYEGCWHVEWVNNVSLENTDAGFWVEEGLGTYGTPQDSLLVFKNNIAHSNGRPEWNEWRPALVVEGEAWELIATNNNWSGVPGLNALVVTINMVGDEGDIYTTDDINNGAFQTGNISVDPQFVDATVPDVHLQPGSPCIDAGVDVGLPYLGSAPDMGAFEFEP